LTPACLAAILEPDKEDVHRGRRLALVTWRRRGAALGVGVGKEPGVAEGQDDYYAERREALEQRFRALPSAGTDDYWRVIEQATAAEALPLEVLGRCLRERLSAGMDAEGERIFVVIMRRIQPQTQTWARRIAGRSRSGRGLGIAEDLEQECYMAVWEDLVDAGPTFLLEDFSHALLRIQQHVAHDVMEKEGEWQRRGVTHPTRVPRRETDSIEAQPLDTNSLPLADTLPDQAALAAFAYRELCDDLTTTLAALNQETLQLLYDLYWRGLTQQEIAEQLHVTDRTIRNRLSRALECLRRLYLGSEEEHRG